MFSGYSQNFWVNLLGFNLIWSLSIFVGNAALPVVIFLLILHFLLHQQSILELQIVLMTAIVGYSVDAVLTVLGFFSFDNPEFITPVWLLFLWLAFCATLRQSLSYFSKNLFIAAVFGAVCGTFAYMAAAHFGAVQLSQPLLNSAITIGLLWCLLFPGLVWISRTMEASLCS